MFKVSFPGGLDAPADSELVLEFRKFRGDKTNAMVQPSSMMELSPEAAKERVVLEAAPTKVRKEKKRKVRRGEVEKLKEDGVCIVSGLFKQEENVKSFVGMVCDFYLVNGEVVKGELVAAFGKAGKVKIKCSVGGVEVGGKVFEHVDDDDE